MITSGVDGARAEGAQDVCVMLVKKLLKHEEMRTRARPGMNPEDVMLSERSQPQRDKCCHLHEV